MLVDNSGSGRILCLMSRMPKFSLFLAITVLLLLIILGLILVVSIVFVLVATAFF